MPPHLHGALASPRDFSYGKDGWVTSFPPFLPVGGTAVYMGERGEEEANYPYSKQETRPLWDGGGQKGEQYVTHFQESNEIL